jgi:hypothetical protein
MVESAKKELEAERREVDSNNLTL